MELPFAVESSTDSGMQQGSTLHQSDSSLVTASSQGSFMNSSQLDGPLPPNTPQDVVLPRYENRQQAETHGSRPPPPIISGPMSSPGEQDEPEIIDFTYVNVSEDDADDVGILLEGGDLDLQPETQRGDILTVLLSGIQNRGNEAILARTENANLAATKATQAKKSGDLMAALEYHSQAAKLYRDNAMAIRDQNASLANSLLLLSQTQAKSALSLKGIVKLSAAELQQLFPSSSDLDSKSSSTSATMTQKDRLRAAVRGALGSRHPHEEDISDSQFLGRATSDPPKSKAQTVNDSSSPAKAGDDQTSDDERGTLLWEGQDSNHNAVDEMMELERELRDMDMALEMGNSISSLDTRMQNRMKNSIVDGSFMVVPPGSNSYMSSSMWGNNPVPPAPRPVPHAPSNNTAHVRARANRVQTMLEASATPANRQAYLPQVAAAPSKNSSGLESSWWGNASTTSQVLTSSMMSLGGRPGDGNLGDLHHGGQPANTKQLMRLMDSLKTLGDENATLLREVEDAEAARLEAKAAREEMKKFREEYTNRLSKLKAALKKYAQEYPQASGAGDHPVQTSEFHKSASTADQLQRQEQLIRKLTADLKKEKETLKKEKDESRKKDQALRKYENFYREVKARSAQKAAQKTQQQRQHKAPRKPTVGPQR